MREAGIPIVESTIIRGPADVGEFFRAHRGPVVMKALPSGVAHKNDAGMVLVNIRDQGNAMEAFQVLQDRLEFAGFSSATTMLIQPMVNSKVELIVGISREPGLGHFLVVGLGGVHAEVLDQVLLFPLHTQQLHVEEAIGKSRIGHLLAKLDASGIARKSLYLLLHRLGTFVDSHLPWIDSIDLNPVLVTDEGCIAVDALVCMRGKLIE